MYSDEVKKASKDVVEHWKDLEGKVFKPELDSLTGPILHNKLTNAGFSIDADDCAFCNLFEFCEGCPIHNHVGAEMCEKTPYFYVAYHLDRMVMDCECDIKNLRKAVKKETTFVKMIDRIVNERL